MTLSAVALPREATRIASRDHDSAISDHPGQRAASETTTALPAAIASAIAIPHVSSQSDGCTRTGRGSTRFGHRDEDTPRDLYSGLCDLRIGLVRRDDKEPRLHTFQLPVGLEQDGAPFCRGESSDEHEVRTRREKAGPWLCTIDFVIRDAGGMIVASIAPCATATISLTATKRSTPAMNAAIPTPSGDESTLATP